ncbi:Polycystin-1 [Acropora cervicornis]|uniref:Polycystin-1 n=1 Tax=Acropora cervicornis TaxID=6130 RepID=A0AAD9VBH0_ACRCE|nr:Polycystin-1 [Acropora cervicornis]
MIYNIQSAQAVTETFNASRLAQAVTQTFNMSTFQAITASASLPPRNCYLGTTGQSSIRDCGNICNGTAVLSACHVCWRPGKVNPLLDCNGNCSGTAKIDDCNICTGGETGLNHNYLKDGCGVCNGTNSTCIGCDGVLNSGKVNDACDVCDGNGTSCTVVVKSIPRTIASCDASVLVVGAGFHNGDNVTCTKSRNVTHAVCDFEWFNYTPGNYNLSLIVIHNNQSDIKINPSIPVYYYNCSQLTVTNVSPNEVLLDDLPSYVILTGSGFFDWAGSETICFIGSQGTMDVMYVNSTNLKCKLSLSLSMDGGRRRVGSLTLTVFARAPRVVAAKFSGTAAEIIVNFDKEVKFAGKEACGVFFEAATVAKLGQSPECRLKTTQQLEITLGNGASIEVNDSLDFKENVFKARGQQFSKSLSGSFTVNFPDVLLKPTPSSGSGGRAPIFKWSLISPSNDSHFANITDILSALSDDTDRVHIPGGLLTPGTTYEFELRMANFLNPAAFEKVTHSVVKVDAPVPLLSLSSSIDLEKGEAFVSQNLVIKVTAVIAPCVNNTKVGFLWSVSCPDAKARLKVETSASFMTTKTKPSLSITKGVLTSGVTCTFSVTVAMDYDSTVKSLASVNIKALPSPLVPAIVGGSRQIGVNSGAIIFDALTQTVDPENSIQPLRCSWLCRDENDDFCFSAVKKGSLIVNSSLGCIFQVQSNEFTAGKTYNFSVEVSKSLRRAATFIMLTVVEGNPPKVWMGEANKKVLAHERVSLEGFYKTSVRPVKVEWTCLAEAGFAFVSLSNLQITQEYIPNGDSYAFVTLPKSVDINGATPFLKRGSKYRFQLTVNDGSKDGVATVDVDVRSGPTSGSLTVDNNNVKAMFDSVTMRATGWIAEKDAFPLKYAFGALSKGTGSDCKVWGPSSNNPENTAIMPAGSGTNNTLTLCVVVQDSFGSFATAQVNITSSPPDTSDLGSSAVNALFSRVVEAQVNSGNLDKALSDISNIASTIQDSAVLSPQLKREISQKTQNFIVDYLASSMANAAAKILGGLGEKSMNDDQAQDFFDWMGDLTGTGTDNDTSLDRNMVTVVDKLGGNLVAELILGDPPREVVNDKLGTLNVRVSKLNETELPISSKPGAPKFDPGTALRDTYGIPRQCGAGKTCIGLIVKLLQFARNLLKEDSKNKKDTAEVYDDQVVGLDFNDPVNKAKVLVHRLSSPIKLTFNIGIVPKDKNISCGFFNETIKAWLTTGMKALAPVGGDLVCESTHATFFGPFSQSLSNRTNTTSIDPTPITTVGAKVTVEEEKNYTAAIVGGVIGGVVFIIVIIAAVWWCSKKGKAQTRVSVEELQ